MYKYIVPLILLVTICIGAVIGLDIRFISSDPLNNSYGTTLSGCLLSYELKLYDNGGGGFSGFNVTFYNQESGVPTVSSPSTIVYYTNSTTWIGKFSFTIAYGYGDIKLSVSPYTTSWLFDYQFQCLKQPYPLPIASIGQNYDCMFLDKLGPCTIPIRFNTTKYLSFTMEPIESTGISCFIQYQTSPSLYIMVCTQKTDPRQYTQLSPTLTYQLKDIYNRYTNITFTSIVQKGEGIASIDYKLYPAITNTSYNSIYFEYTTKNHVGQVFAVKGSATILPFIFQGNPSIKKKVAIIPRSGGIYTESIYSVYYLNYQINSTELAQFETKTLPATPLVVSATIPDTLFLTSIAWANLTSQNLFRSAVINRSFKGVQFPYYYQFPYGIIRGNYIDNTMRIVILLPGYSGSLTIATYSQTFIFPKDDSTSPQIEYIEIFRISIFRVLVRIKASDNESGVYSIVGSTDDKRSTFFQMDSSNMVFGDKLNGIFEKVVTFNAFNQVGANIIYTVTDFALNSKSYNNYIGPDSIPQYPFVKSQMNHDISLTKVYFKINDIDLSTIGCDNVMYINYTAASKSSIVQMRLLTEYLSDGPLFTGQWDDSVQMIAINFKMQPRLFTGDQPYLITSSEFEFVSSVVSAILGPDSRLRVSSDWADYEPPFITKVVAWPSVIVSPGQMVDMTFGWVLTVEDQGGNGFDRGLVSVISQYDGLEYNFTLQGTGSQSQDFNISIQIQNPVDCQSQLFTFSYVQLFDRGGHETLTFLNTFIKATVNQTAITLVCPLNMDNNPPVLTAFEVTGIYASSGAVDVGSQDRSFNVSLTITDNEGSQISLRHSPKVYLEDIYFNAFIVDCSYLPFTVNSQVTWMCPVTLPYGFGSSGGRLAISIYGFSDTLLNFGGYSAYDLMDLNLQDHIPIEFNKGPPLIQSTSRVSSLGGPIEIFGKYLGNTFIGDTVAVNIYYNGNTSDIYTEVLVNFITSDVILVNSILPGKHNLTVQVKINSTISSNLYTTIIDQIQDTKPPVIKCLGTPECGGPSNGKCTSSGCQCNSPWVGVDCLSQLLNNTVDIDPSSPNSGNNYNTTIDNEPVTLKSLISIVSIDEISFNGSVLVSHEFNEWVYTNTTSSQSNSNIQEYQYKSTIEYNGKSTKVVVTVQHYSARDTVFFAGEQLEMLPSTLKYKISVTSYAFKSPLNSLRLVMLASLESTQSHTCSNQEFTNDDSVSSDYMKLQINNNSLYGRFVKRAVIDNRIQQVSNQIIHSNQSTSSLSKEYIGILIPHFDSNVVVDPDFSLLVDTNNASDNENSICTSIENSGLTRIQKIGIIVGSVVFGVFLLIIGLFLLYKHNITVKVHLQKVIKLRK
ncbi:hypothetical protein DLAC_05397 [Tieghemostelium lacteum]|uniref:EGF-like domain-containing protein n=1 Tax=Tieghemostelium lacteum TaxID=361077 RepID=A0A151ZFS1_TIELA|nr:hypothetical protein DLAC_05397 [Tieghemostelium lacteum]|eukprot:KYQ92813.1 hypothetical protein DLAC_05397 [Tieghemostelium lacteum]